MLWQSQYIRYRHDIDIMLAVLRCRREVTRGRDLNLLPYTLTSFLRVSGTEIT